MTSLFGGTGTTEPVNNSGFFNGASTPPEADSTNSLINTLVSQVATVSEANTQAQAAAVSAEASANNAHISETNVSTLAQQATTTLNSANTALSQANTAIDTANTAAATANTQAGIATTQASAASTSAAAALASQNAAKTSETNSKNSETNAASSASSAASNASSVAAVLASMNSVWLGAHASDPTVDNNGNALAVGAEYLKTSVSPPTVRVYTSSGWQDQDLTAENASSNATLAASQASSSASAASSSASAASSSATAAASSASSALTQANNAASSASAAASSASNASASASSSASSASAAAASAASVDPNNLLHLSGGTLTGGLTAPFLSVTNTAGYSCIVLSAAGYGPRIQTLSPGNYTGFVNGANTAYNLTVFDGGQVATRGALTVGGNAVASGSNSTISSQGDVWGTAWGSGWLSTWLANNKVNRAGDSMWGRLSLTGSNWQADFALTNNRSGVTATNVYLRARDNGGLDILNNAYNAIPWSVSDSGEVWQNYHLHVGPSSFQTDGNCWLNGRSTWLFNWMDAKADHGTQCYHGADGNEFGSINVGYANNTTDAGSPWVLSGIRSQNGSNVTYLRAAWLKI
ncbi:hypothetical protein [Burkholderia vietnamiensis]|uniref:hypothetical protein n=1 Tax=Burkholderia vietnamiensis TaxID=60552 RepID=UPI00264E30CD|nr:hypothetical protein [Burkholderia vietnamiensis]MDN8037472.1 hypothetical protein [Burkholderia vietnamiensis]